MAYLVCDSYSTSIEQPTSFEVTLDAQSPVISPAQTLGDNSVRLHYDVSGVSTGDHQAVVRAYKYDEIDGDIWSEYSTPFLFRRSGSLGAPSGISITLT